MDKELITYLQQMEARMDKQFARVDERFTETDGQLQSLRKEVVTFREETEQGFKEVKEDIRLAHVSIEDLRGDVRQVADGVATANERLDEYKKEVSRSFREGEALYRPAIKNLAGRVTILEKARKRAVK